MIKITIIINLKEKDAVNITGVYRCDDYKMDNSMEDLKFLLKNNKTCNIYIVIGETDLDTLNKNFNSYLNIFKNNYLPIISTITRQDNDIKTKIHK